MKLEFQTQQLSLADARELAEAILAAITTGHRLDKLAVADVCAYLLESKRKPTASDAGEPGAPNAQPLIDCG